jgi:hypothetical protein
MTAPEERSLLHLLSYGLTRRSSATSKKALQDGMLRQIDERTVPP